jgi:hypothetical protein
MKFKDQHPNYKGYESNKFYVSDLPRQFSSALQGFIINQCQNADELKALINDIAGRIPTQPTSNWGWNFLIEDLPSYVIGLCRLPLPKIMDFLSDTCANRNRSFSMDDLNEFLEGQEIGFALNTNEYEPFWELRADVSSLSLPLEETIPHVKDTCAQALEHLEQAKGHLQNTKSDRGRKDAIRDCMSAMEAMVKALSGESDIKAGTAKLRASSKWGPDLIVKDGLRSSLQNVRTARAPGGRSSPVPPQNPSYIRR